MLFFSWQLKTTVYVIFLASCLGHELFPACERDYCYQNQRDVINIRINEIGERHVDREAQEKHRLSGETRRDNAKSIERVYQSDVTRHLDDRSERKEFLGQFNCQDERRLFDRSRELRQTLGRLNERVDDTDREPLDRESPSKDNRREHHQSDINKRSLDNRQELHKHVRTIDERYASRRLDDSRESEGVDERLSQEEREPTLYYKDKKQEQGQRYETLRLFNDRKPIGEISRRSDLAREFESINESSDRKDNFRQLVDQKAERKVNTRSEHSVKKPHDSLPDGTKRSQRIVERLPRMETKLKPRVAENTRNRNLSRRSEENRIERLGHDNLRQFNDREVQRDLLTPAKSVSSNKGRESEHLVEQLHENNPERAESPKPSIGFYDREGHDRVDRRLEGNTKNTTRWHTEGQIGKDRSRISENYREEHSKVKRVVTRRPEDISEERQETLRRLDFHEPEHENSRRSNIGRYTQRVVERLSINERKSLNQRDENEREKDENHTKSLSRFDNREVQDDVNRRSRNSCKEHHVTLRQSDYRANQQVVNRPSREFSHIYEQLSQRKHDTGESIYLNEHLDENEETRVERHEMLRFDDRENQRNFPRHSGASREPQRRIEQLSQREHESLRRDINKYEDRETQGYNIRKVESKHKERRDNMKPLDDGKVQHESSSRLDNNPNLIRIDEQLSERELESIQHRNENMRQHVRRRDDREVRHAKGRRFEGTPHETLLTRLHDREAPREERKRLDKREVSQQLDYTRDTQYEREVQSMSRDEHEEERHETLRRNDDAASRLKNTRSSVHSDKRLNRNFLIYDRDTEHRYAFQQYNNRNNRGIDENYSEKPIVFLQRSYMILGQGAILAYVIMKTLNGKNDLRYQLPIKIREAMEFIGF